MLVVFLVFYSCSIGGIMMFHGLMRGTNIFYRGYVIHEEIKAISYTIYGERPVRSEIARVGSFTGAM